LRLAAPDTRCSSCVPERWYLLSGKLQIHCDYIHHHTAVVFQMSGAAVPGPWQASSWRSCSGARRKMSSHSTFSKHASRGLSRNVYGRSCATTAILLEYGPEQRMGVPDRLGHEPSCTQACRVAMCNADSFRQTRQPIGRLLPADGCWSREVTIVHEAESFLPLVKRDCSKSLVCNKVHCLNMSRGRHHASVFCDLKEVPCKSSGRLIVYNPFLLFASSVGRSHGAA
jgi:hypothetical protein